MASEKGMVEVLMNFSFEELATPRMMKVLYGVHLLLGLVVAVGVILNGFRVSTADGLLMLILAAVGLGFWVLYVRVVLEVLVTVFRIAENAARLVDLAGRQ
jgi:hypothetical protein